MMRRNDSDSSCQEFLVQSVHREGRTRVNKEHMPFGIFTHRRLAPLPGLLPPLIDAGTFDEPQVLHRRAIVRKDCRQTALRSIEIENPKSGYVPSTMRIECHDRLVVVCPAVEDAIEAA